MDGDTIGLTVSLHTQIWPMHVKQRSSKTACCGKNMKHSSARLRICFWFVFIDILIEKFISSVPYLTPRNANKVDVILTWHSISARVNNALCRVCTWFAVSSCGHLSICTGAIYHTFLRDHEPDVALKIFTEVLELILRRVKVARDSPVRARPEVTDQSRSQVITLCGFVILEQLAW